MLQDNGRIPKQRRNYFMTLEEFQELISYVRLHYDIKWYIFLLTQFSLGMRVSECSAINIYDFKDKFKFLDYRQAKTNKMIYSEPIPDPLRKLLIAYVYQNSHRLKNGFLFPNYNGKGNTYTTETIGSFWSKWRKGLGKTNIRWLDKYDCPSSIRYRIGSHSLRRLHRTFLSKKIDQDFIVAKLCHYDDFNSYLRYKNEFEILENASDYILPHMNPILSQLTDMSRGQQQLRRFI